MKDLISVNSRTHYAGKQRKVGERFRAKNADAAMLIAVGFAKAIEAAPIAEPPRARRTYRRRDMTAEPSEGES